MERAPDVFVAAPRPLDLRLLFEGRGELIEAGLTIIDADVPIAGVGDVDFVGIDATRRLVLIDVAGPRENGDDRKALGHASWFVENHPLVRRMYQLWNIRWEAPARMIWITERVTSPARSIHPTPVPAEFACERVVAIPIRTREGREAVVLWSEEGVAAPSVGIGVRNETAAPAQRRVATRPQTERIESEVDEVHVGRHVDHADAVEAHPRGEAYRRELGLTREEFAEFFVGPSVSPDSARGGGDR